ncbi:MULTISPECIES: hypothetical protein [unclassified Haematobacter]|uniref:hypothetical protein n=1 Tax=unclassified Haematobacter TaxID=2640585 RepID=UPI0025C11A87|nr:MULTISPECIES: hypothetical protein [unclassified Haematobacter]
MAVSNDWISATADCWEPVLPSGLRSDRAAAWIENNLLAAAIAGAIAYALRVTVRATGLPISAFSHEHLMCWPADIRIEITRRPGIEALESAARRFADQGLIRGGWRASASALREALSRGLILDNYGQMWTPDALPAGFEITGHSRSAPAMVRWTTEEFNFERGVYLGRIVRRTTYSDPTPSYHGNDAVALRVGADWRIFARPSPRRIEALIQSSAVWNRDLHIWTLPAATQVSEVEDLCRQLDIARAADDEQRAQVDAYLSVAAGSELTSIIRVAEMWRRA